MRKILLLPAAALLASGCADQTEPAVATALTVSPTTITMNAIGAKQRVRASVTDQRGDPMSGAGVSWTSSSAAVSVTSLGGDSAVVTSTGNGTATVTATAGSASAGVSAQVAQVAALVLKSGGDAQTGTAGAPLPAPIAVVVQDALGAPMAGVRVAYENEFGGGSLSSSVVTTDAAGTAASGWTLGRTAGMVHRVVATAEGLPTRLQFTATVVAGPPAEVTRYPADAQAGTVGMAIPILPRVLVLDAYENGVAGLAVEFTVTEGGGSVTGGTTTTVGGAASPGSWTLGPAAGVNKLTASFPGTTLPPMVFSATAAAVNPATISIVSGDNQAGMAGTAVGAPSVIVRDAGGRALPGVPVVFAVTAGGGSVGATSATTNASGVATPGSWTLGPTAGRNTISASVQGRSLAPAVVRAAGCSGGGGTGYALTLCFTTTVTASQRAAFENAAARWSTIIRADLSDVPGIVAGGTCGAGSPRLAFTIDDLVIFATIENIDGSGGILGSAGWCHRRSGGLPAVGSMRFDAADVASLEASGRFGAVILHEMGHVLGIGNSLWTASGLLQNPSTSSVQDTYFSGAGAIAGFDAIGGTAYHGGHKVPVENTGGTGTANSHWRETVLANELMTGFLNTGSNPLSILAVRSLADLGYTVDVGAADAFSLTFSLRADGAGSGPVLHLGDDAYTGPRYTVDPQGRRTRIR